MRKLLLNPTPLFRKLRQLSLLLSLLLALPQTAWGQTEVTYTFGGLQTTSESGYNYTVSSTSGGGSQTWKIMNFTVNPNRIGWVASSDSLKISNITYYDSGTTDPATTITFDLLSDFTLTGEFFTAEISYCTNKIDNRFVTISKNDDYSGSNLTHDYELLTSTPATISLSPTYTDNKYFNGNKIAFHFSFTTVSNANQNDGSFTIKSIKITTYDTYGLTVAGTVVSANNATNVLGDGKVSYNATNNTLTMNGATINYTSGDAITASTTDPLNVNVIGTNSISCGDQKAFNTSGNLNFQTSDASPGQLTITSTSNINPQSYYICAGAGSVTYENGLIATNPTSNSVLISINYGINVGGSEVTSANATNVFGENTPSVSYDADNNILTLNQAIISGAISTELNNLTINLKGANSINTTTTPGKNGIISNKNTGTLTFTKEGANASLTITSDVSVIRGFASLNLENNGLYTNTSTPYKIKSDSSYPRLADATTSDADTTAITSITISDAVTYQLWLAGNQVTGATNITGSGIAGTVSFNANNSILTLTTATINGTIISSLGDLTIHLKGYNLIQATGTETSLINSINAGTLTFETEATTGNSLNFRKSNGTDYYTAIPINGFTVAYETGLGYFTQHSEIKEALIIEYNNNTYKLYNNNANDIVGDGGTVKYSYDATNGNVLTLNNADIEVIEWELDALTIALNGACSISNTGHTYAINYHGSLNIVKASGATSAVLTTSTNGSTPINTTNLTLGSGLYLKPISNSSTTIIDNPEFVLFNGYAMTNGHTITQTNPAGSLVYNESGSEKTLTFTNFQDAFGDGSSSSHVNAIETGVVGLKVIFVGNNKITCNDAGAFAFKSFQSNASIQFVKGGDGCKLTMDTKTDNPLSFGSGKVTYDRLIYYSSGANEKYICEPTAPTMGYNDQEKVTLGKTYTDGDIYYTITYADGKTANVAKTKYTAEFALDAPGTVEAWVEANGATTSTVKGKHFGYKDAPFVMAVNETKTPELIPAIETGDDISCNSYSSSDDNIATFTAGANGGVITAKAFGNATLTTTMAYSGQTANVVILNSDKKFETVVKVAKEFNYVNFASGQSYATCILPEKLTKPDGLKVYYITGTNGNTVTTQEIDYLPDGIPILLEKTAETIGSVTARTDSSSVVSGNILQYATSDVNTTGSQYILYKNEFVKASGTILPGKCYLQITTNLPARGVLGIGNDGSTAIEGIEFEATKDEEWYDLQGRRIQKPTKPGLYIVNGKKVVVTNK